MSSTLDATNLPDWRDWEAKKDEDRKCDCGSVFWRVRYGEYKLIGKCAECGGEEELYSG